MWKRHVFALIAQTKNETGLVFEKLVQIDETDTLGHR